MLQISQYKKQHLSRSFLHLEEKVFEKKPILKHLYNKFGDHSLLEFTKKQYIIHKNEYLPQERRNEAIQAIAESAGKLLGKSVEQSVSDQLKKLYTVVTSDHHGPLTSAGFFNSNLLLTLNALRNPDLGIKNIIVLSCSNISFDNDSFPRGHLFHTVQNSDAITNQLVFFPRKVRPLTVFKYPSYTQENIMDTKKRIGEMRRQGVIKLHEEEKLMNFAEEVYGHPDVLASKTFSEQVTKSNYSLWKKLFNNKKGTPNLIYLEQESIVTDLILKSHLHSKSVINQILFDNKTHEMVMKHFDGITGGFSLEKGSGTFLFWALPKDQKYRLQLWKEGNKLVSKDGTYSIELTPENLERALRERELIPSTMLSFIILALYYGLTLFGGRYQTTYLSQMKHAYNKLLKNISTNENQMCSLSVHTDHQCITSHTLAFLSYDMKKTVAATPLDFLLYGETSDLEIVEEMAKTTTFKQAIARILPHMYEFLYQTDEMQHITPAHIDKITGFHKNIKPFERITT